MPKISKSQNLSFQTRGYEDFELSTQILIAEALKRRIAIDVLDRQNQFIRLRKGKHIEYVESATKTSQDSYVASLILGNKLVTKHILKKHSMRVPHGEHYENQTSAFLDYARWKKIKCVVKPKTTNYGIGISILKENISEKDFRKAVTNAFQFDRSILIEEFIEGIECRFLVIGGKTVAVLNRIPANVIGDGKHTIAELIKIKNRDPRRGKGHKTPLEYIEIRSTEKEVLQKQHLTPKSIPKKNQQIFLRHNSNISTGGDSIDFTDKVHASYKRIAEKAAGAADAKICGVDIILEDFSKPASKDNYGIIELNYNPVLYFHDFPYEGKNRKTAKYVLDLLGF